MSADPAAVPSAAAPEAASGTVVFRPIRDCGRAGFLFCAVLMTAGGVLTGFLLAKLGVQHFGQLVKLLAGLVLGLLACFFFGWLNVRRRHQFYLGLLGGAVT